MDIISNQAQLNNAAGEYPVVSPTDDYDCDELDIRRFCRLVLPESRQDEFFSYATLDQKGKWRQTFVPYRHELITKTLEADAGDSNIFYLTGTNNKENRSGDFAAHKKALFCDIDVGKDANSYATAEEAREAIDKAIEALGLGQPLIVSSGMGFHLYWPLKESVKAKRWKGVAEKFKKALMAVGLIIDPTVPADLARVLRLPGTTWRDSKGTGKEPRTVTVVDWGDDPQELDTHEARLDALLVAHGGSLSGSRKSSVDRSTALSVDAICSAPRHAVDLDELRGVLAALPVEIITERGRYPDWLNVLMALHKDVPDRDAALELADDFSAGHLHGMAEAPAQYKGRDEIEYKFNSFDDDPPEGKSIGLGTVYHMAEEAGWDRSARSAGNLQDAETKQKADAGYAFERSTLDNLIKLEKYNPAGYQRAVDLLHKGGAGKRDLNKALKRRKVETRPAGQDQYSIGHEGCYRNGPEGEQIRLSNFDARIIEQVTRDDGFERTLNYTIEGRVLPHGQPLPPVSVPVRDFMRGTEWTAPWGNRAVIEAGQGVVGHLRCAIQKLSGTVTERDQYGHTGWREIDGKLLYLTTTGAIGENGLRTDVEVNLDGGGLRHYALPSPNADPGDLVKAVQRSLGLFDISASKKDIGAVAASAAYTAPLGHWLELDVAIHFWGTTGCFKTETAALALQHFGDGFSSRHLTAGWNDSLASLLNATAQAKDAVIVIDDFKTQQSGHATDHIHQKADRLFVSVGNRKSEGRANRDGTARKDRIPRGLILSTGEVVPDGESARARTIMCQIRQGDIDSAKLAKFQRWGQEGVFALAMAGYIQWLAIHGTEAADIRQRWMTDLRNDTGLGAAHRRSADNLSLLLTGFEMFLTYAASVGALHADKRDAFLAWGRDRLLSGAAEQAELIRERNEGQRFLSLLKEGYESGRFILRNMNGPSKPFNSGEGMGINLGWRDKDNLYLNTEALTHVRKLAIERSDPIFAKDATIKKQLADAGLLQVPESARAAREWTTRKKLGGGTKKVLQIAVGDGWED